MCSNVKKIAGISFPIVAGPYSCASRSHARNLAKSFDSKIKLIDYEVIRPQYDQVNFVRDHLKLGYTHRHVPNIEDYWAGCYNEYQTRERYWSRLTINEIKLYNDIVDVYDLADDGSYMHPSSYEQVKKTPIVSTLPKGPIVDTMEVLMRGIIKRTNMWVEWTRARKKRTRSASSTGGVASKKAQSTAATSTIVATSTLADPTQFVGRGDQPPKKNIQVAPTYRGGSVPDTGKVGNDEKNKEEQEKSVTKPPSLVQVINLDGENNPLDGQEQDASQQGGTFALSVTKVTTFPTTTQSKETPPMARKLFDPTALQSAINVLSTESWLEETIDRKKIRCEEVAPSKDLIVQATSSQPPSKKAKKQWPLILLLVIC